MFRFSLKTKIFLMNALAEHISTRMINVQQQYGFLQCTTYRSTSLLVKTCLKTDNKQLGTTAGCVWHEPEMTRPATTHTYSV